jgi:hypothetical protein
VIVPVSARYLVDELRIVAPAEATRIVGGGARLTNALVRPHEWIVGRRRPAPTG